MKETIISIKITRQQLLDTFGEEVMAKIDESYKPKERIFPELHPHREFQIDHVMMNVTQLRED